MGSIAQPTESAEHCDADTSLTENGEVPPMADEEVRALAQQVQVLEDREAIRDLKALYCEICDDGHDPGRIVEIFTADGIWESDSLGEFRGRDAIRAQFAIFRDKVSFSQHMVTNPVITVEGDSAHGTWYFLTPIVVDDESRWNFVRYDDDYVRVDGRWKIEHLRVAMRVDAARHGRWLPASPEADQHSVTQPVAPDGL